MADNDQPYVPKYKGFDEEATKNAQATAERSREGARDAGAGEPNAYVEEGAKEAGERTGRSAKEVEESVERAAKE